MNLNDFHTQQMGKLNELVHQNQFIERNKEVIREFEESMGDIREAFEKKATDSISYLRLLGFKCAACGTGTITEPILRYFNYGPQAKCYQCQELNK